MGWLQDSIAADAKQVLEDDLQTKVSWGELEFFAAVSYGEITLAAEDLGGYMDEGTVNVVTLRNYFQSGIPDIGEVFLIGDTECVVTRAPDMLVDSPIIRFTVGYPDGTDS